MAAWMLHGLCCGEEAGARNLVFFRVKWLQATMKGTSCVRRVRFGSFRVQSVPPMGFAMSGCSCVRSSMRFLTLWWQIALEWLHEAAWMLHGLCCGEEAGARNLVFFRVKWLQATMKGTSCVRRVRFGSFRVQSVPPMGFATSGCSCVRSSMRFLTLWWQIALEWLHECCMGYVVGRKPEHETLCFSVWSGCRRRWKVPRVCDGCGLDRFEFNRFLLWVLQRVVVPVCVVLCVSWRCGGRSHWNGCMMLHECCMGYVVGRKPEHETSCFFV